MNRSNFKKNINDGIWNGFTRAWKGRLSLLLIAVLLAIGLPSVALLAQGSGSFFTFDQGLGQFTLWPGGTLTVKSGATLDLDEGATVICDADHSFTDPATFESDVTLQGDTAVESGGSLDIESGATFEIAGTAVTKSAAQINALVGGAAGGYRLARGETALDGSNPTSAASGLTTLVACTVSLKGTSAPGVGTSVVTSNINGTSLDLYGWKVTADIDSTLIASDGTETVDWICIGT